jgi:hypothetical protein
MKRGNKKERAQPFASLKEKQAIKMSPVSYLLLTFSLEILIYLYYEIASYLQ